ncbi:MAG: hypothetical protein U0529_16085 [Thermoanaerobaculia bacterium]
MDVSSNLAAARSAVAYVKARVPFGASNRPADYTESYRKNHAAIEGKDPNVLDRTLGLMTAFLPLLTGANRAQQIWNEKSGNAPSDPISRFRQIAEITTRTKAGNCTEQSITAFVYLYDLGTRPLAWINMIGRDHAFVLVGMAAMSGDDPAKWGDATVVCDPWNNEAYTLPAETGASILQTKWGTSKVHAVYEVA